MVPSPRLSSATSDSSQASGNPSGSGSDTASSSSTKGRARERGESREQTSAVSSSKADRYSSTPCWNKPQVNRGYYVLFHKMVWQR
ncbi:hypothetical protein I79_010322 [Cricetulus griseus]|uniref:Uncharacterized protein n=1 Tax=Cricetulus griseus TaxID=10029 RepID=G3HI55_CRIGR|nr:hypothetical protein I79_010322 [Cricetulus griseus]